LLLGTLVEVERIQTATTIWLKYKGASMGDYNYKCLAREEASALGQRAKGDVNEPNDNSNANTAGVKSINGNKNANKNKNINRP
jgi:hypothetical protein